MQVLENCYQTRSVATSIALRIVEVLAVLTCLACFAVAGPIADGVNALPQDTGLAGLKQTLIRLQTTARLMHTAAHPDDEDGGMLTLESRGKGAEVVQLTLNRGEGGQNKIGSNLFDALGVVRTLELLAADRYYGVEQRFTRVADFGFSKTPDETFRMWGGHDAALGDMVRVIRTFRPDVIVSRFQGNSRDGHGHHQAAAILTREAFRAAADPTRFPEQIKEGLQPWQAKKLYIDNVRPPFSTETPAPDAYTLELDTGVNDPLLGMSYAEYAMQGLKHQLSQGAGAWTFRPGRHLSYYKLVDSVLPVPSPGQHESGFFDGIDTSIAGLASRLGGDEKKVPQLRTTLQDIQGAIEEAGKLANSNNPAAAAQPLLRGQHLTGSAMDQIESASLSAPIREELLALLADKKQQFSDAAKFALSLDLQATVDNTAAGPDGFMAVPGESFLVNVTLREPTDSKIKLGSMQMDVPTGWRATRVSPIAHQNGLMVAKFRITVPPNEPYTRPCWHRNDPATDTIYMEQSDQCAVLPLPIPPVRAIANYFDGDLRGSIRATVMVPFTVDKQMSLRPLEVGPAFSVELQPATMIVPTAHAHSMKVSVRVRANVWRTTEAQVSLKTPAGWKAQPSATSLKFAHPGEIHEVHFTLIPPHGLVEDRQELQALVTSGEKSYGEGYTVVSRPDLAAAVYYQPAKERISAVNVKVPTGLKVGYIMGAGDEIPTVLRQAGLDVTMISTQELASGDLAKYGTIVLGIRAYDTRDDVRENNKRLLDYVSGGGTLLVQYNADIAGFNSGHYTPYPMELSRDRVTVEEAPVDILAPMDSIFRAPNGIAVNDFGDWVQERGLYFANQWDEHYQPLLASHDPDEEPLQGGLLRAHYGKGLYIYTGYAFFRQLPAGVPGAVRLFVNLVGAGHEQ